MIIEFLFLFGLVLITAGVGFVYWPAALIFAGVSACVVAYKLAQIDLPVTVQPEVK